VRGLGRFFKQVCQSARQGSQDDFLGSINIPISVGAICMQTWTKFLGVSFSQEIPSTGLEGWFKLEGRSHRSNVQGRIRLKLWLSTRDDHGQSEDDILVEMRKLERCYVVFMQQELATHEPTWGWSGDIQGSALTILHQMAVQADLSELQCAMARFVSVVTLNNRAPLDPKFIHRLMLEMDRFWIQVSMEPLGHELEQWLAKAMSRFVEISLSQMRRHRDIFPALHPPSLVRLEFLLRCLGLLGSMRAFRQVCPFSKGVRGEIVNYLRKGSVLWAQNQLRDAVRHENPLVHFTSTLLADLQTGLSYYHPIFDK
jgi:BAI1-associated protein 3